MVALLVAAIGVLALVGLVVAARSRIGTDPSSSVAAFNRALTAMESGAGGDRAALDTGEEGPDAAEESHPADRAHPAH